MIPPETLKTLHLKDPQVSQKGAKSCQLVDQKGCPVIIQMGTRGAPLSSPLGACTFGNEETARKTIEFSLDPDDYATWGRVAEWARGHVEEHCERIFKKKVSAATIAENFRAPAIQKGEHRPLLRCKLQTAGSHAVRCWNGAGERVELPEDLRHVPVTAMVHLDRLWMMGRDFGLVLVVTDLQLLEESPTGLCPFERESG